MPEALEIGGRAVAPGETCTIDIPVARLYTHTPLTLAVRVMRGRRPGPRLLLCAAIHGDEINGVEIIRRVLARKSIRRLRGALVALPVVNVHGFINRSRYMPDRRDLNRAFPGIRTGSLAARMAWLMTEELLPVCTHGIDLHSGSNHRYNIPQIRGCLESPEVLSLALMFGAPVVLDAKVREGSLREAARERGVPMLLYEGGEALRYDEGAIAAGVRGVLSVMRGLGMIVSAPTRRAEPFVARSSTWVRAGQSGIFRARCKPGAAVEVDEALGTIGDPFGEHEQDVRAHADGVIIGVQRLPLVNRGDALVHIARTEGAEGDPERVEMDI